jgi:hypothetical protein
VGAIISLDYSAMKETYKKANQAAEKCGSYAKKIDSKINQKITSLKMGGNNNTSNANYFAKQKIDKLNEKKMKYSTYATKMENARTFAKDTDVNVSTYIKNASNDFRNSHDMKVGVIAEFFSWATTTLINSTTFGRWINQVCKDVGTWIDSVKRKFKDWYELDGGKYIIKTALAVVGTIIAVIFLVWVAWPALLGLLATGITSLGALWTVVTAVAGVVTAVIAVADGIVKSASNFMAALTFADDPGWAKRYNSYSSVAEFFRKHNFKSDWFDKWSGTFATIIDVVTVAAAIINIVDLCKSGIKGLRKIKEVGWKKVFFKVTFKSPSGKVSRGTIIHGIKRIFVNIGEAKKIFTTTNISILQSYYQEGLKFYKTLKSGEKILKWIDSTGENGISSTVISEIKKKIIGGGSSILDMHKQIQNYQKTQKTSYAF